MKFASANVAAATTIAFFLYASENANAWKVGTTLLKGRNSSPIKMVATTSPTKPATQISRSGHDPEAWKNGYTTCPKEITPTTLDCPDLPKDFPAGTYYRNGHGRFESDDGIRTYHMFDGDGLVTAMTFDPLQKKVLFRNRFIRTDGYVLDKVKGIMSKPGIFGTRVSGGFWKNLFRTDFKNVANTHVMYQGDKLYALWEGGWPYILDPLTLENDIKKEPMGNDLNGLLREGQSFAAHYRIDARTGNVVNFGQQLDPIAAETTVQLYEFYENMKPIRPDDISFVFEGAGVIHDFCVTENWHVFVMPPAGIDNEKALQAILGRAAFAEVIDFDKDATQSTVYLVPCASQLEKGTASKMRVGEDKRIKTIKVPFHFSFHYANAFEDDDGNVVIDSVLTSDEVNLGFGQSKDVPIWESIDFDTLFPGKYVRFAVNPEANSFKAGSFSNIVSRREPEFPVIPKKLSSKQHRYVYSVGSHREFDLLPDGRGKGASGAILKLDTEAPENNEAYAFQPYEFVGEPAFCAKQGVDISQPGNEDNAYLVTYVLNGRDLTTEMVIFDVEGPGALEKGPITRMQLPTFIPFGLHGTFVEGLTFDM